MGADAGAETAEELATLRSEVTEELKFVRAALAEEFNSVRSEILDLNINWTACCNVLAFRTSRQTPHHMSFG
ncbi:hypothetical protein ACFFV7_42725 [Nonomuraea spiralis]|uniref:Uncharacterized protein n=1 Tax=Nonomuraea spiralis TaxID=46182 RepID=A0ABV5ITV4_9ACTN|nr:hypothetical protein [Nonomuraea spiralis]